MRGCPACPQMIDYARTFRIPVWSWPDATYPSISRWFINTYDGNLSTYGRWRYSHDLVHFSQDGGELFAHKIAGPFLKEQILTPRVASEDNDEISRFPASKWNDVFEFDLHITPKVPLKLSLATYTSWGVHENTLLNITQPPLHWFHNLDHQNYHHTHDHHLRNETDTNDWVFEQAFHRRHAPDSIHTCYASSSSLLSDHHSSRAAEFFFATPTATEKDSFASCSGSTSGYCSLSVSSLHSWNRSYIGNLSCSLFSIETVAEITSSKSSTHLADVFIDGNLNGQGSPMEHTSPISALVYSNITDDMRYILRCRKLDELYACIDSITISIEIDVR